MVSYPVDLGEKTSLSQIFPPAACPSFENGECSTQNRNVVHLKWERREMALRAV